MANVQAQAFTEHLQTLFSTGTCAGLSDGELLDRFLSGRDEAGELAFEALVTRHGPMVMRVCRNLLDDPHDLHDAFQAVFLVLARRGGAIHSRESVGSWLYGVAVRVAAAARAAAIHRRVRDRRTSQAAREIVAAGRNPNDTPPFERNEGADIVHQEVSRLPEKYRAPIVLCYLEGLTHDEAAARLSCPVGTVRSRLSRARQTLRNRLNRRGVVASTAIGPVSAWLAGERMASSATATTATAPFSTTIPGELPGTIARVVSRIAAGQTPAAASLSVTSLELAQGVIKTMMLKKLTVIGCALLPIGMIGLGGGAFLVQRSKAQDPAPAAAASGQNARPAAKSDTPKPAEVDPLLQQLLEAARKRLELQRAYFNEGQITLDRYVNAFQQVGMIELKTARNDAERLAIRQRMLDRLKELEVQKKAEFTAGTASESDVVETTMRRLQAELDLKASQTKSSDVDSLLRRLTELERKVEQLQKERVYKPEIRP
jgi:RNA polymerase sigma factor (sigma-70 family)